MNDNSFLLYGANGYTGRLILKLTSDYNLNPVLAGRNESALVQLSEEFNRDYFVLDLSETEKLESVLKKFPLVLHCAGPFINTAQQMIKACLKTGTHYIDILFFGVSNTIATLYPALNISCTLSPFSSLRLKVR